MGVGEKLGVVLQSLGAFIASFVVAFVAQWKLTLIVVCVVPALLIIVGIASGFDAKYQTQMLQLWSLADTHAEDAISSMRTVTSFSAAPKIIDKFDELLAKAHKIGNRKSYLYAIMYSTEFFVIFAGYGLAFWQGVHMYDRGEISSPGPLVTVIFSITIAATQITQLAPSIITFTNAISAAGTVFKIIDTESKIDPFDTSGTVPQSIKGDIDFANVNFAYPTRANVKVLDDFTLNIPAKKVTALVGASGSGKSTVVGLFERWYNPLSGSIRLDGNEIRDLNLAWLRSNVGMVGQEPTLFTGTVLENVYYGLVGSPWEHVEESEKRKLAEDACRTANAHDFIMQLPKGYDSPCGERGGLLSGGQKQRIAIARSIISQPTILLLDEATAALDVHSEAIVQDALDKASANRTTIVIAHKLATIRDADNIVVIAKGKIIEQGTHNKLLELNGAYANLVDLQDLGHNNAEETSEVMEKVASREDLRSKTTAYMHNEQYLRKLKIQKDREDFEQYERIGTLKIAWKLLKEQKKLKWTYFILFLACLASGATYPGQALLFTEQMSVFQEDGDDLVSRASFFALMFLVLAIGNLIVYAILGFGSNNVCQVITHVYKKEMFTNILRQDMQFFDYPENMAGALTSRLASDPQSLNDLMGFNLAIIFISIVNLAASCGLALGYGWKLSVLIIFAGLPALVASGYIRIRLDAKMVEQNTKSYSETASFAGEAVGAIRTVSSLKMEQTVLDRFKAQLHLVLKKTISRTLHLMVYFSLTQTMEFFFLALCFWYGCRLLERGEYTLKQFYIVFLSVFFAGQAMGLLFTYTTSISKAKGAGNYIFWLRNIKSSLEETSEDGDFKPDDQNEHHLAIDKLRFAYPLACDTPVLRGIDITIKPGQFIAFVGASGCGKSTMIAMLERFYDPVSGSLKLDEKDIRTFRPQHYRRVLALVQQEPTLYMGSIRDNVALGLPKGEEVTEEMIIAACRDAHCWDFISSLPEGLETSCGSKGLALSGGQRQRIAIARALIRQPKILLLDEATSALDTGSEKIVQQALSRAAADSQRITIAVAHRLSTIKFADRICVFVAGRIAEVGNHSELLAQGGIYAKMCEAQSLDRAA